MPARTTSTSQPRQALYLTYRPATFADLAGQAAIVAALRQAVQRSRVAHAYLFTGPRGTGKTTMARLLAKAVNCRQPKQGEPDNRCELCHSIGAGSSLDVLEIDAASHRGIDEIRELREKVRIAPGQAARKVYIIDEVHMLTKEAFNALLKTLEEPPEFVTFILATTEPAKVPATIISRCQRFDLKPPPVPVVAAHLGKIAKAEGLKLAPEAGELMARHARGSFRDGLSILDLIAGLGDTTITAEAVREVLGLASLTTVASLERALATGDAAKAVAVLGEVAAAGTAAETFRLALIDYLRTLMLAKVGATAPPKAAALAADWQLTDLTAAIRSYLAAGDLVMVSATPELALEVTTLELLVPHPGAGAGMTSQQGSGEGLPAPPAEPAADPTPAELPTAHPMTEAAASQPRAASTAKSIADPKQAQPKAPADRPSPSDAGSLWEALLLATKQEYALSVCLQKTRPVELTADTLTLAVESDFFLKKLSAPKTKAVVEQHAATRLGRPVKLALRLGEPDDVFAGALKVFEGAEVE